MEYINQIKSIKSFELIEHSIDPTNVDVEGFIFKIKDTRYYLITDKIGSCKIWVESFNDKIGIKSDQTLCFLPFERIWKYISDDAKIEMAYHFDLFC
jgi:hypothetical protein